MACSCPVASPGAPGHRGLRDSSLSLEHRGDPARCPRAPSERLPPDAPTAPRCAPQPSQAPRPQSPTRCLLPRSRMPPTQRRPLSHPPPAQDYKTLSRLQPFVPTLPPEAWRLMHRPARNARTARPSPGEPSAQNDGARDRQSWTAVLDYAGQLCSRANDHARRGWRLYVDEGLGKAWPVTHWRALGLAVIVVLVADGCSNDDNGGRSTTLLTHGRGHHDRRA